MEAFGISRTRPCHRVAEWSSAPDRGPVLYFSSIIRRRRSLSGREHECYQCRICPPQHRAQTDHQDRFEDRPRTTIRLPAAIAARGETEQFRFELAVQSWVMRLPPRSIRLSRSNLVAAGRAVRILGDSDPVEARAQRVVDQQRAVEAVAEAAAAPSAPRPPATCRARRRPRRECRPPRSAARGRAAAARGTGSGSRGGPAPRYGRNVESWPSNGDSAAATSGFSSRQHRSVSR